MVFVHLVDLERVDLADDHACSGHVGHLGFQSNADLLDSRGLDDRQLQLDQRLTRIERHEDDFEQALLFGRQGYGQVAKGVELDRDLAALQAVERGLEQTVKRVDDDTVVAFLVVLPRLFGKLFVGLAYMRAHLDVRFVQDAVQIFVEAVEKESKKLVRILLLETRELRRETT